MAGSLSTSRIALWSILMAGSLGLSMFLLIGRSAPPMQGTLPACQPLPANVRLEAALAPIQVAKTLEQYGDEGAILLSEMQPGDTVHPFRGATTGGHAVMRGECYIGRATAWLR